MLLSALRITARLNVSDGYSVEPNDFERAILRQYDVSAWKSSLGNLLLAHTWSTIEPLNIFSHRSRNSEQTKTRLFRKVVRIQKPNEIP